MKKILIFADGRKSKARETAASLRQWLSDKKIKSIVEDSPRGFGVEKLKGVDLVVSLGGDGTILLLAHATASLGVPILPIDLGGLGFLATCQPGEARKALSRVLSGNYKLDERMMLSASLFLKGRRTGFFKALNEIYIHRTDSSERLLHLNLLLSGKKVATYSADGLVAATPTGSTAYSLSAGGPIVSPKLEAIVLTAICPHALSVRPIVISPDEQLRIVSARPERKITVSRDGERACTIQEEEIVIEKAAEGCRLIQMDGDFYQSLKTKLQWAGEYRRLDLENAR